MPRGGKREGAGRKPSLNQTTKATIYLSDRPLLNSYAHSLGIPVNELIHKVINHPKFNNIIDDLKN